MHLEATHSQAHASVHCLYYGTVLTAYIALHAALLHLTGACLTCGPEPVLVSLDPTLSSGLALPALVSQLGT